MELREYQRECVDKIDNMKSGTGLVSMATGLGKTVVFSRIKRKGRVLILSHREELVRQPLKYYDCKCGIERAEDVSHGEEVVSASVQSLIRRLNKFSPNDFDLIITDEAHHAAAPSYRKIYDYFKPRLHIGFTATPNRGDKLRLDNIFEKIIFQRDLKWGILNNYLTDIRCLRASVSYNLTQVRRKMGDFMVNDLDRAVNIKSANKEIAEIYRKYATGQTLIFAASVAHAENIAAEIDGAVVVSQNTQNRKEIIEKFTKRQIPCIVNCLIFTEGTDIPLIETVIIARPTQNASLYTQMVGRGLRKAEGKKYLTLIDCVGVTGKLDVCTAPCLMGLDVEDLPKRRLSILDGMLTDMPNLMEQARNCPEIWMLNVKAVNLFALEQKVNVRNINWTKKGNGDLVYQFTNGDRIGIKAINELGKTRIMYFCYDEHEEKFRYRETEEMSLQEALDVAYDEFRTKYADDEKLWNLSEYYGWENAPATERQKNFIFSRLKGEDADVVRSKTDLTKGEAAQILNAVNLKNTNLNTLLYLRKKKIAEDNEREEERKRNSLLRIRKLINREIRTNKYYAVKLSDDLIITNDWKKAEEIISESNGKVRYKGFTSISEAEKFLRS